MTTSHIVQPTEDRRSYGIGILLLAQLAFTFTDPSAKLLGLAGIPIGEIVFVRYAVNFALVVLWFWPQIGMDMLRTREPWLEFWRGLMLLGTTASNFLAVQYLPLTITSAIMFSSPLIICLLAGPMLGERMTLRRWIAVGAAFVGILIITQPGTASFEPAMLLSLGGAICSALYAVFTRRLAGRDTAATQQFYATLLATACIAPFAFQGWVWPSDGTTWIAFFAVGVSGMLGHLLLTVAHRFAPASVLAPFSYLQILNMSAVSWLVFSQPPSTALIVGASIIIGSGLYLWLRER